jgi:hypothetical protein
MRQIPRFKWIAKRPHRISDRDEIDLDYLSTPDLPYGAIAQISRDTRIPNRRSAIGEPIAAIRQHPIGFRLQWPIPRRTFSHLKRQR